MALKRLLVLAAASLMLVACRSDPVQFYTLTPTEPVNALQANGTEVQVEAVSVPPQVDRQQIVIRRSDSTLSIQENDWWASSLRDELQSALAQELPKNESGRRVSVLLDVQRLDSIPGQYTFIDVKWRLRDLDAKDRAVIRCRSALKTAAGVTINDIVIAHQQNLRRLAAEISQAANDTAWRCPEGN